MQLTYIKIFIEFLSFSFSIPIDSQLLLTHFFFINKRKSDTSKKNLKYLDMNVMDLKNILKYFQQSQMVCDKCALYKSNAY